ncbi:ankyrin repeat domain-containing protein [Cucumibacter marinus]|jgi:ankyrin repeat protein|uniref:ankyrin repeat domain-containing protein n=1 Tax=Cucumibacter marinus TaxID=1121252 RepID=UPI000409F708|nr:ankyrin repeat domain-containing protein [Cucumibacter marinus]
MGFVHAGLVLGAMLALATVSGCERPPPDPPIARDVRNNDVEAVRAYLAEGGDPNAEDGDGDSLLYISAGPRGGAAVMALLLEAGADPEKGSGERRSALQNAAGWCTPRQVQMLVDAGADPLKKGWNGKTPLDEVCAAPEDRRQEVIEILERAILSRR